MNDVLTLILGGGRGTRLYPLTHMRSKPAVPLGGISDGFVEVLAAEQTPESSNWFQGTADAVRQAARHFVGYDADYFLILAGDHLYRMDFCELIESQIQGGADITIAAQPVSRGDATEMGIFSFDQAGQIVAFEEKPNDARLGEI